MRLRLLIRDMRHEHDMDMDMDMDMHSWKQEGSEGEYLTLVFQPPEQSDIYFVQDPNAPG